MNIIIDRQPIQHAYVLKLNWFQYLKLRLIFLNVIKSIKETVSSLFGFIGSLFGA
jgi:hypothetical protein